MLSARAGSNASNESLRSALARVQLQKSIQYYDVTRHAPLALIFFKILKCRLKHISFLGGAHLLCRDVRPVYSIVDRIMALAEEYGFPNWIAAGQMLRAWAGLEHGDPQQALADLRLSVEALKSTGALIWSQFSRYLVAVRTAAHIRVNFCCCHRLVTTFGVLQLRKVWPTLP